MSHPRFSWAVVGWCAAFLVTAIVQGTAFAIAIDVMFVVLAYYMAVRAERKYAEQHA